MFLSRPAPRKAIKKKVAPPSLKIDLNVVQKAPDVSVKPKNISPSQFLHSNSSNSTIESFRGVFSKLTDSIYMGDCICAQNKEELLNLGITHIINCAGMKINNFFPDTFIYKKIELYDNPAEEIYSLFYEVIDFIQNAVQFAGKVFIHCNYGVSRSAVMAICYFIYSNNWSYETALKFVKQQRPICEPNAGFVFSLITWDNHRKNNYSSFRAYSVVPLSECSSNLVAKFIQNSSAITFDSTSCYIIQTTRILYIWMGNHCTLDKVDAAVNFTELLQRYEKAVGATQMILQDKEPDHFRSLFS